MNILKLDNHYFILSVHLLIYYYVLSSRAINCMQKDQNQKINQTAELSTADKPQKAQAPKQKQDQALIGHYHEAPDYMKDNQHITHGYRINFDTPIKIFKSLFMIHNESVNIWSHCLPAIIICIFIVSIYFIVDNKQLGQSLNNYKNQISEGFSDYSSSLQNLTVVQKSQNQTQSQFQEMKSSIVNSCNQFIATMNQNLQNINNALQTEVSGLKDSLQKNVKENMQNFQQIKQNYEKVIAPQLLQKLNTQFQSFNSSFIEQIKSHVQLLKEQMDSEDFNYLDVFHHSPNPHHISRWPILVFLFSAAFCFFCSTCFHLFYPMSSKSYVIFNRFDYSGISILISGSTFPPFYYSMYCYLEVALVYEIIIMSFGISLFFLSAFQWIHRPQHKIIKAMLYAGFGLFNIVPISHLLINDFVYDNFGDTYKFAPSIPYYLLLGASYLFGLYVYTVRCPERHYPGKFNVCGHSHQIWHICTVLGVIFTYMGALQNFQMRKNNFCPIS